MQACPLLPSSRYKGCSVENALCVVDVVEGTIVVVLSSELTIGFKKRLQYIIELKREYYLFIKQNNKIIYIGL